MPVRATREDDQRGQPRDIPARVTRAYRAALASLPAAELQARIDEWIETIYEREPHGGLDGRTPFAVAAGQPFRRIENERALDILLVPPAGGSNSRRVHKGAVKVDRGKYFAAELAPFRGLDVEVRLDPGDLGVVYIMAGDVIPRGVDVSPGQFVCQAKDAARLGTDRAEEAARAKAYARAADRAGREHARDLKRRYHPERFMGGALDRAGREADRLVAFPAAGAAHAAPGLDEAAKAAAGTGASPAADNEFFRKHGPSYMDQIPRRASGGQ